MRTFFVILLIGASGVVLWAHAQGTNISSSVKKLNYSLISKNASDIPATSITNDFFAKEQIATPPLPLHIDTPTTVTALYMSSWVGGTTSFRGTIVDLIDTTQLNAVIIDIKDATGKISYTSDVPLSVLHQSSENRIPDIEEFIKELHKKDIYVIGRVTVFQDPHMAQKRPDWAVRSMQSGLPWKDKKGLSWIDPSNQEYWQYIVDISSEAYEKGFDEINFDYIRYPTDGVMSDMKFVFPTETPTKSAVITRFLEFAYNQLHQQGIPVSIDIFGLVVSAKPGDDIGIGQQLALLAPHTDYIAPMIYPSHYGAGVFGYANPAEHPYEIVARALSDAKIELQRIGQPITKLRPWIQDFNLGAVYTPEMVSAQIQAAHDQGIYSWMVWDPKNKYTDEVYTSYTPNNTTNTAIMP